MVVFLRCCSPGACAGGRDDEREEGEGRRRGKGGRRGRRWVTMIIEEGKYRGVSKASH